MKECEWECKKCKYARETNLNDEISHGELFCIELVRFFSEDFGCNKFKPKLKEHK